jgi:minor extracellular serine protease Vpr
MYSIWRWVFMPALFIALAQPAFASKSVTRLDPFIGVAREMSKAGLASGKAAGNGAESIHVFIKTTDLDATMESVEAAGGRVGTATDTVMTASIPVESIQHAAGWPGVVYVEAGKPVESKNDRANASTHVDDVLAGVDLPQGFDGKGVIVGLVDSGIDFNHEEFADADGETRVYFYWDQADQKRYFHTDLMRNETSENAWDTIGHGTHVAATAAGADGPYPGVAPGAGIIMVKLDMESSVQEVIDNAFSTDVCDGVAYIFERADELGLPAVVNLSLATPIGPHDGSTLFEECLNELLAEKSGRAIVAAAGNAGKVSGGAHSHFTVTSSQDVASVLLAGGVSPFLYVDIWEDAGCDVDMKIRLWDVGTGIIGESDWVSPGGNSTGYLDTIRMSIDRLEEVSALNGRGHSSIALYPETEIDPFVNFFDIVFSGECSGIDAWTYPDPNLVFGIDEGMINGIEYVAGDNENTVEAPATASNVVAVGAYASRTSWTSDDGASQSDPLGLINTVDDLAFFSSRGPSLASVHKPNLTAPGAFIISARSGRYYPTSEESVDYTHSVMSGTSMASPHVAGIVALMLEAYPGLTYSEIVEYLQNTARTDAYVGSIPNADWGYGKVDGKAAVSAVLNDYPLGSWVPTEHGISVAGFQEGNVIDPSTTYLDLMFYEGYEASSGRLYIVSVSDDMAASTINTKTVWDADICSAGTIPSSVYYESSSHDPDIMRMSFEEELGEGNFAVCVEPSARNIFHIKYGGATIPFTTVGWQASTSSGSGGGCSVIDAETRHPLSIMSLFFIIMLLLALSRRNVCS